MREIKFRAWDLVGKQWLWITGIETTETRKSEGYTFGGLFHDGDYVGNEGIELMQFTGLYDKNGREIYEGDILRISSEYSGRYLPQYVYFRDGAFMSKTEIGGGSRLTQNHASILEVIGNTYEHPELIEG